MCLISFLLLAMRRVISHYPALYEYYYMVLAFVRSGR